MNKKVWWKGFFWSINLLFLAILLGFSGVASATTMNAENLDHLAAGETIDGPGFFAGNVVKVDGNVEGTTFCIRAGYPDQWQHQWRSFCGCPNDYNQRDGDGKHLRSGASAHL